MPEPGINIQARGPIHEAFAQPTEPRIDPEPAVPKPPPDPIPEEPPEQKLDGADVVWIPGYWSWNAEQKDYLWVSGFWRVPPPGRQWIPGHWTQVNDGWQRAPGFWAAAGQEAVEYVKPPPDSLDYRPVTPAPDENSFYVPGNWMVHDNRYWWRPGYWKAFQSGWIWTNAHYCWTPAGYVFVDGYWDYGLEGRGLLFAPVYFDTPLWNSPGWYYRPRFVVELTSLLASLFVRPLGGQYYFGDYYDPAYAQLGFQPWYAYGSRVYDPLFNYYRWDHRGDSSWYSGMHNIYLARRNGDAPRPPRTFREQTQFVQSTNRGNVSNMTLVAPLEQVRGSRRLAPVSALQVKEQRAGAEHFRELSRQRNGSEKPAVHGSRGQRSPTGQGATVSSFKLPSETRHAAVEHQAQSVPRQAPPPPTAPFARQQASQAPPVMRHPAVQQHSQPAPRQAFSAPAPPVVRQHAPPEARHPAVQQHSQPAPRQAPSAPAPPVARQHAPPEARHPAVQQHSQPAPRQAPSAPAPPVVRQHAPPEARHPAVQQHSQPVPRHAPSAPALPVARQHAPQAQAHRAAPSASHAAPRGSPAPRSSGSKDDRKKH